MKHSTTKIILLALTVTMVLRSIVGYVLCKYVDGLSLLKVLGGLVRETVIYLLVSWRAVS